VSSPRRVASPPAKMTAGMSSFGHSMGLLMRDNPGALKIEAEPNFPQALFPHSVTQSGLITRIKHEKAATAGPNDFPTRSAVGHGVLIVFIDFGVAHICAPAFFALPVYVHEISKLRQVAVFKR